MDIKAIYQRYVTEQFARRKARIFKGYAVEEIREYCREAEKPSDDGSSHDRKMKGFLWGTVFTWALSLFIIGINICCRGISEQPSTTIPVAFYATFGILFFVLPGVAIVLLARSFSRGHRMRTLFSILHIGWNALIVFAGLFLWVSFVHLSRTMR